MEPVALQPGLANQVYQALLNEIREGALAPGAHLVQERLAAILEVSRQPIQQALALLKSEGLARELGRRGLFVAALELAGMRCVVPPSGRHPQNASRLISSAADWL